MVCRGGTQIYPYGEPPRYGFLNNKTTSKRKKTFYNMDGIIMAGGKGTRMRPLTDDTPKPLLNVGGRPILEWSL